MTSQISGANSPESIHRAGTTSWEYMSEGDKKKFDEVLASILAILQNPSPTEADSAELDRLFKELKEMKDKGLLTDPSILDFVNFLFAFMQAAGANPATGDFHITPTQIMALGQPSTAITVNGQSMSMVQAISAALDPEHFASATETLGQMLLSFNTWAKDVWEAELDKLHQQVKICEDAVNLMHELQNIMNLGQGKVPSNYVYPPTKWDDIPPSIQEQLKKSKPDMFTASGEPKDISKVLSWIKNNPETYSSWTKDYFTNELGIDASLNLNPNDPNPDPLAVANKTLEIRDQIDALIKQLEGLGAPDGEGSELKTLRAVLEDINTYFPQDQYPIGQRLSFHSEGVETEMPLATGGTFTMNVPHTVLYCGDKPIKDYGSSFDLMDKYAVPDVSNPGGSRWTLPIPGLDDFIVAGNTTSGKNISDDIGACISASENLQSTTQNDLKQKNMEYDQFCQMIFQIAEALHKILMGFAKS